VAGTVTDAASAYEVMKANDANAFRSVVTQPSTRQADSGHHQLGDSETEWHRMQARDRDAWKTRA
jgi:hypothetical protein